MCDWCTKNNQGWPSTNGIKKRLVMPNPEADHWNEKYQRESELWLGMEPRQLLVSFIDSLPTAGLALDAACGVGINAIYLAGHGLRVIGFDISEYALQLARLKVKHAGLPVEFSVIDLGNLWLPERYLDVITNFHYLERGAIPVFQQALKPGGLILFDTFMATSTTFDTPGYYLYPGELRGLFDEFEIIHYEEFTRQPSRRHGERGAAQIVARKPVGKL
jgi:SAM-dependent methyltransferase